MDGVSSHISLRILPHFFLPVNGFP
jgi:hypothetical protein